MRVSFAGGGTDVPLFNDGVGGRVVGSAIDVRVNVLVEPFERGWVHLESAATGRSLTRRRGEPARQDAAFRLIEAALEGVGIADSVRVEVRTDIAPGAGLGGSGAAAVAILGALVASFADVPEPHDLASQAMRIEREGLGLVCGWQDPIFAAWGGTLDLSFDAAGGIARAPLAMSGAVREAFAEGFLLVDTLVRRVSSDVLERLDASAARVHATELVAAANDVASAFAQGSLEGVLAGMRRSAAAKVRRDPIGSALALDLAKRLDGLGAEVVRMCGAGGGGHVLVWAPRARHSAIVEAVAPYRVRRPAIAAPGVRVIV